MVVKIKYTGGFSFLNSCSCNKVRKPYAKKNMQQIPFNGNTRQFPPRLQSKYQDILNTESQQLYIKKYLELFEIGLNDNEIVNNIFHVSTPLKAEEQIQFKIWLNGIRATIKKLDASFDELIPSLKSATFYRAITDRDTNRTKNIINNAQKGDLIIPDISYSFATSNKNTAIKHLNYFNDYSKIDKNILMIIKTPRGIKYSRDLSNKDNFLGIQNVVFQRGVKYQVLNKDNNNNNTIITLEYLK